MPLLARIPKDYLGGGAYVESDDWSEIVLTTEDGLRVSNRIVLDGIAVEALERYIARARAACHDQITKANG